MDCSSCDCEPCGGSEATRELWPVRHNFRGLDESAAEEGRVVFIDGESKGVDGRDEERSFGPIVARKRLDLEQRL